MEPTFQNMTDEEWKNFASWLKTMLKLNTIDVTFTKKDGTERVMKCTLNPDKLPKKEINEEKKAKKESETSMAVFDLEKKEWRSFTIKSIKRVEITVK